MVCAICVRLIINSSLKNIPSIKLAVGNQDEFRSTAQVVAAMKDPRYGKDSAYTKDVEQKLGRSSVF